MTDILECLGRFIHEEDAPTMAEYALLLVLVAFSVVVGASLLGTGVSGLFTNTGNQINTAGGGISLP